MELDQRLRYLGTIPHAQRSILLLSAAVLALHPSGKPILQDIQQHHQELDGQELSIQVLLDLMISISGKWDAGSAVLSPLAALIGNAINEASEEIGPICPWSLAEQIWGLIEQVHDQQELSCGISDAVPSCN